jgi:hypothetical protein
LGWLNARASVAAPRPIDVDALVLDIIRRLHAALAAADAETAHLKVIGMTDESFAVANLVSRESPPELSLPSHNHAPAAELIVNARVSIDPARLNDEVRCAVGAACSAVGVEPRWGEMASFRPGRPVPTHRMAAPA